MKNDVQALNVADGVSHRAESCLESLQSKGIKSGWPGGCSGVVVNRLNGAVVIKVVGQGLWRSSDQGATWQRLDNHTVSGRDETGWATSVDQNDPRRMASFSLDGSAGWTTNGTDWKSFAHNGRNWDFGCYAWDPLPHVIYASSMGNPVYQLEIPR